MVFSMKMVDAGEVERTLVAKYRDVHVMEGSEPGMRIMVGRVWTVERIFDELGARDRGTVLDSWQLEGRCQPS